jgi:lipopolysaccharide/colanic/teichoic acid biosynthesis glycosyltransferase
LDNELKINLDLTKFSLKKGDSGVNIRKGFSRKILTNISISFLIYLFAFFLFYFLKEKSFNVYGDNLILLGLIIISLSIGAYFSQKFVKPKRERTGQSYTILFNSFLISLTVLTVFLHGFKLHDTVRDYALISMFFGLVLESYYCMFLSIKRKKIVSLADHKNLSVRYLLFDGFILTLFCYFGIFRPLASVDFAVNEFIVISVIYISWLVSASTTHKFIPSIISYSRWNAIELQIKFYLRMLALLVLSLVILDLKFENSIIFVQAFVGYSILSSLVSMFMFAEKIKNKTDEPSVVFLKAYEIKDTNAPSKAKNGDSKYSFKGSGLSESTVKQKLQFEYLKEYGDVFAVLDSMLDLASFDTRQSLIIKSDEPNDISEKPADSFHLVVNLHVLNDQKHLNTYILDVKKSLVKGGVFVGALLPHHYRYKRFLKKNSFWVANILYFFDFVWKRILPKLPVTREIYAAFSKEKDRAISLAEGLGRLAYCGFKIIDLAAVDDVVYFAALKNGGFSPQKKFFYSPIFKMKRVGKDGKPIYVYKLRTMYPYSEFIQDFVYNHNKLESGGKFKDDFRVPVWGKIFRKLWIDELPMLINWAKRDLKVVGVRPISNHYLSLYSPEHQERRKNFKPGLLPPFYADMPDTLKEIELSEKRYLDSYEKNPFKTDARYFFKAVKNIVLKNKRSA